MNPWLILGAVLAVTAAFGGGYVKGNYAGQEKIQQQWDKERAALEAEYASNLLAQQKKEQAAQDAANRLRVEKDRELREINARATALANSLRDRPDRPATNGGMPADPGACSAATGAQLARGDAEFLAGYSSDAARLKRELDHCVSQYNEVKVLLSQPNKKETP